MTSGQYFVECACARKVPVQLYQAGTNISCPGCRKTIAVPGTSKLQLQAGDNYPLLSPIDKICRTLENGEAPFDGICHACASSLAEYSVNVQLKIMQERELDRDGGVSITPLGVKLEVAGGVEHWRELNFPLLLCGGCHRQFKKMRARSPEVQNTEPIIWLVVVLITAALATNRLGGMAFLTALILILRIAIFTHRITKRIQAPAYLIPWIRKIRWVPEILESEEEYVITIGSMTKIPGHPVENP